MASAQPTIDALAAPPVYTPPGAPASSERPEPGEQRFLIRNIDWATYRKFADAVGERHYRLSFDGRDLELMTTHIAHDRYGRFLGDMVLVLAEETDKTLDCGGEFTMEREDLEQAIESDETFYLDNEPLVRGKKKLDLKVAPPPDLAGEIDLTTDSRRRLKIYAQIQVPEIWRYDGKVCTILQRQPNGEYASVECSRYFPFLTAADLTRFLQMRDQADVVTVVRAFRQWVREQLGK